MAEDDSDLGDFHVRMDGEEYYVNSIRDLRRYVSKNKNASTERKTKSTVKRFQDFVESEGFKEKNLEEFDTTQLDALIGNWLMTAKKDNGDNYEPDTLTSMHRCIDRYLTEANYKHSIVTSPLFDMSRKVIVSFN